ERALSRLQRTGFGVSLGLSDRGHALGVPWERTIAVRWAGQTFDSRAIMGNGWSGAEQALRRDEAAESRLTLDVRQSWSLGRTLTATAGARLERYRTRTGSLEGDATSNDASQWTPTLEA